MPGRSRDQRAANVVPIIRDVQRAGLKGLRRRRSAIIMSSGCAFVALPFGRPLFFPVISRRVDIAAGHRLREVRGLNHE
jgi:hypothetical protein